MRIRRTNKVGNGERKSIWQGVEGSQIHILRGLWMFITEDILHVVHRLSAVSTNMSDELLKLEEDGRYKLEMFHLAWKNEAHKLPTTHTHTHSDQNINHRINFVAFLFIQDLLLFPLIKAMMSVAN